jgi:ATP-dependent Lhr-like helicase
MSVFNQLCRPLQEWLVGRGWTKLRSIQELAFSPINNGNNTLLIAPTAGGKTEAAMLPLLNRFYGSNNPGAKLVYVAPLRALINSLENRFIETRLCDAVYFEVFKWHGDVSRSKKFSAARALPDILLTTPESLDVILCSPYVDKTLFFGSLEAVVIDETHYFAGNDRGGQLVSVLSRLGKMLHRDLQRICLSATLGNPDEVLDWIAYPSKRQKIVICADKERPDREVRLNYFDLENEGACKSLSKEIVHASTNAKSVRKSIVFQRSRSAAEKRSKDFRNQCCICHVHHGSVDKFWRERAEFDLMKAKTNATIIATCTLELGIDVGDLDLIQQEGDFANVSSYIQRIGRTGRIKPPQRCFAYAVDEFEFLKNLAIMILAEEGFVESNELPTNSYHLLLQQLIMMSLCGYGVKISEALSLPRSCAALKNISDAELRELLDFWIDRKVLRICDDLILVGPLIENRYSSTSYRDLYVMFDSPCVFEVRYGSKSIGTLDYFFVRSKKKDFVFILAGQWWQAEAVDFREGQLLVKPFPHEPPAPQWASPCGHEVSFKIAQKIKEILLEDTLYTWLLKQNEAKRFLTGRRQYFRKTGLKKTPYQIIPLDNFTHEVITYGGDRVNLLLAELVRKLCGWEKEDVTFASFVLSTKKEPVVDFGLAIKSAFSRILEKELFACDSLLEQFVEAYDDPEASKWSEYLPVKHRRRLLAQKLFDVKSTKTWIQAALNSG